MSSNVWLLTVIQALAMSAGTMMVLVGGLLGARLAPEQDLATLPLAMMVIGTACGVIPVTRIMRRLGRKPVFIGGALLAAFAAVIAAQSTRLDSFYLFLLASFLLGISVASFQQIRFAAMESVSPNLMARAASTVLLGGLIAALLGPELASFGRDLTGQPFTGTFYLMALVACLCAALFTRVKETHQIVAATTAGGRKLGEIARQPVFIVAVSASVVGYALMSFVMTATPVHMHVMEQHSLEHTKWVIQSHIIAMFLPSFISGWLISRVGVSRVIVLGILAYALTVFLAMSGNQLLNYWSALVLLGIGWNFLFLAGTVLLPRSYEPEEKFLVQGSNEFMVFAAQAMASLGAGAALFELGWQRLLMCCLVIIVLHSLLLSYQAYRIKVQAL